MPLDDMPGIRAEKRVWGEARSLPLSVPRWLQMWLEVEPCPITHHPKALNNCQDSGPRFLISNLAIVSHSTNVPQSDIGNDTSPFSKPSPQAVGIEPPEHVEGAAQSLGRGAGMKHYMV